MALYGLNPRYGNALFGELAERTVGMNTITSANISSETSSFFNTELVFDKQGDKFILQINQNGFNCLIYSVDF